MNEIELEVEMKRHNDLGADLAAALNISHANFIDKKKGKSTKGFTQTEIAIIQKRYDLSSERLQEIFFADEMS